MKNEWIVGIEKDPVLSPYTGWTRAHWMAVLEKMLLGVLKSFSKETGQPDLPLTTDGTQPPGINSLATYGPGERLGRPMILAALYMKATGRTRIAGFGGDIAETFRNALAAMARMEPSSLAGKPFYYDCDVGVQMSLVLAWDFFYEPLDGETKKLLKEHYLTCRPFRSDTNWRFFDLTQAMLLRRMGEPYDLADANDLLASLMNMYRGDGWFIDGWNQQYDFYNFWGFQLYLHLLTAHKQEIMPQYEAVLRGITDLHEQTFPYWLDADGNLIGHGRSMSYRFAAVCGIQWAQISGLSSMSPGLARRLSSGCIKAFVEHECLRDDGTLPIGYWGENATVGEEYNSSGGPYWAALGLTALILPGDHPFWTETEQPSPSDSKEVSTIAVRGAQMVFKTGGVRREARLQIAGDQFRHFAKWEAGVKYYQHSYSSTLGFAMSGPNGPGLSVGKTGISADGENWVYRTKPRMLDVSRTGCRSEWNPGIFCEGYDGRVMTESFFLEEGELHVFTHFSSRPQFLRLGGWSVRLQGGTKRETPLIHQNADGLFTVRSAFNSSLMLPLPELGGVNGRTECVVQEPREGFTHTHLFGGIGGWTQWTSEEPVEPGCPVAIFVDAVRNCPGLAPAVPDRAELLSLARSARLTGALI
jgi:hypothetical protein